MTDNEQVDLVEARRQLKANLSILAMLKGNTPLEDITKLREEWVEPLEQLIENLEKKSRHLA